MWPAKVFLDMPRNSAAAEGVMSFALFIGWSPFGRSQAPLVGVVIRRTVTSNLRLEAECGTALLKGD